MTTKTIGRIYVPILTIRSKIFSVDDDAFFGFLEFAEEEDMRHKSFLNTLFVPRITIL